MKSFVKNRAASEGCIAECYLGDEVLNFVMRYFDDLGTNSHPRIDDNPTYVASPSNTFFPAIGKPVGGSELYQLTPTERSQAHRHVLTRYPGLDIYRE